MAEVASIRCARAVTVRELKSHMTIPFLIKCIPLVVGC
jgi:hypothetical protein